MVLRKKDILPVCEALSSVIGAFAFNDLRGNVLYASSSFRGGGGRIEVSVEGAPAGYIEGEGALLESAASLLGLYLKGINERRILTAHTLQKYNELGFLSEINKILSSSVDIDEILRSSTSKIHEMISVENCSVMVADTKRGRFVIKAVSGNTVNADSWLETDKGIAGKVLRSGRSQISNDPRNHPDFAAGGETKVSAILCVPLRVKDNAIGVINLSNKHDGAFTTEEESLINSVSVMIAESIENSRLLEEKIKGEKFAAIGQMAAGIIHDIKNPMTTIKGFAGLMGDMEFTPGERKEFCALIVSEVNRLVAMVEDLLAFTRGFKSKLSMAETTMEGFFEEVIPLIETDMSARAIEVVKKIEGGGALQMDSERFKRVVFNIAGNAREAMHDGGKFLILVRKAGSFVETVFSDTGGGIPEDIIDSLFEPFVTMGKKSGTGLGLAISKKIIEEHGGSITAVNGGYSGVEGFSGANFVIRLPLEGGRG